jgi:hypothetical protein
MQTQVQVNQNHYPNWLDLYKKQSDGMPIEDDFDITVIPCSPYGDAEIKLAISGQPATPNINTRIIFTVLSLVWLTIFFIATVFAAENLHATKQPLLAGSSFIFLLPLIFYRALLGRMRKTSAIIVDKSAIHFVSTVHGEVVQHHFIQLCNIERIALIINKTDNRKSKIKIEGHKHPNIRPFEFDLQLLADRSRWTLMKSAIDNCNYSIEMDPMIYEHLKPQDKDPAFTDLWLSAFSTAPGAETLEPLSPAMVLKNGQYEIKSKLGRGGQGTAYLAVDTMNNNDEIGSVVLKESVLPFHTGRLVRNDAIKRFEQEARILQKIDHPNIVKLKDYFVEGARAYLVLEHVSGKSLKDVVRHEGALAEQSVVKLAFSMCEILKHLHEVVGVVHHDFTPENLMLDSHGALKLIDFNAARALDGGNVDQLVAGKLAYMPPEQLRGETNSCSDLYALGGTLYFLLTGQEPEALSECDARQARADIGQSLTNLIKQLTVQDREARCLSLVEVKESLERASVNCKITSQPPHE